MNNAVLSGRLATAPELSYTPSTQTACCRFTLAVERRRRKESEQSADFIRITVWGAQAENCKKWLVKGQKATVQGSIRTGSYTDKNNIKHNTFEIVANDVEFGEKPKEQPIQTEMGFEATDDYVPF